MNLSCTLEKTFELISEKTCYDSAVEIFRQVYKNKSIDLFILDGNFRVLRGFGKLMQPSVWSVKAVANSKSANKIQLAKLVTELLGKSGFNANQYFRSLLNGIEAAILNVNAGLFGYLLKKFLAIYVPKKTFSENYGIIYDKLIKPAKKSQSAYFINQISQKLLDPRIISDRLTKQNMQKFCNRLFKASRIGKSRRIKSSILNTLTEEAAKMKNYEISRIVIKKIIFAVLFDFPLLDVLNIDQLYFIVLINSDAELVGYFKKLVLPRYENKICPYLTVDIGITNIFTSRILQILKTEFSKTNIAITKVPFDLMYKDIPFDIFTKTIEWTLRKSNYFQDIYLLISHLINIDEFSKAFWMLGRIQNNLNDSRMLPLILNLLDRNKQEIRYLFPIIDAFPDIFNGICDSPNCRVDSRYIGHKNCESYSKFYMFCMMLRPPTKHIIYEKYFKDRPKRIFTIKALFDMAVVSRNDEFLRMLMQHPNFRNHEIITGCEILREHFRLFGVDRKILETAVEIFGHGNLREFILQESYKLDEFWSVI